MSELKVLQTFPQSDSKARYLAQSVEIEAKISELPEVRYKLPHYFCTYFDSNYMTRGLALYKSLKQHCRQPFVLWALCFDKKTYDILTRQCLPGLRLISQHEFEAGDEDLVRTKSNRSLVEYYWTCTPSLPLFVLNQNPEVDLVTYLDADLYFFSDPQPIFKEMGSASILIVEHRYAKEHRYFAATSGIYNVSFMSFRRDANGLSCLEWWRERCLEWCYAHYEDGKFGDQMYLDDWPDRFDGVAVLQHKGAGLAPWNMTQYRLDEAMNDFTVDGQPLIFFHFHSFYCVNNYAVEPAHCRYRLPSAVTVHLFMQYGTTLLNTSRELGLPFPDVDKVLPMTELISGLLTQRFLLLRPAMLSERLWQLARWRQLNRERVAGGFQAYQRGDIREMRNEFLRAILWNPLVLRNLGIVSLLFESVLGSSVMEKYRAWRHNNRDSTRKR